MNDPMDYAGKFLQKYETDCYTFLERNLGFLDRIRSIIVPIDAEQFADVSFWQGQIDWNVYSKNARAVFLRIGQGTWEDSEFESNYVQAMLQGLLIGGYVFFDGRYTPQRHLNMVANAMRGKYFNMELVIDWETNYHGPNEGISNVVKLMQLCEAAGIQCKAVGIYTGYYWFVENTLQSTTEYSYLKSHPLWLAWYASASLVKVPPPWDTWTHWQYGTPIVNWGQGSEEIDMNKHNGTKTQFAQRYGVTNGDVAMDTYVKGTTKAADSAGGLRVRAQPSSTSAIIGQLPYGTPVEGWLADGWIRGTFNGLNGYIASEWVNYVLSTPPQPYPGLPVAIENVVTLKDESGNALATYKGTLTKQ